MSKDQVSGKSEDANSEGLKRRDLLLSGTSLLAASALSATGLATTAQAQQPHRRLRDSGRTSSSSWAMTSASGISVPTTAA